MEEYSVAAHVGLLPPIHLSHADYADLFGSARHTFVSLLRLIKQIYKFPQSSLAELARNSVVQSGFEMEVKRHWLGQHWYLPGDAGNEINKVGVASLSLKCQATAFHDHPSTLYISWAGILIADPSLCSDVEFVSAPVDERSEQPARVQTPNIAG